MSASPFVPRSEFAQAGLAGRLRPHVERVGQAAATGGVPPRILAERWRRHVPAEQGTKTREVHPASVAPAPLPLNVARRASLPDEAGWWGFSMRDVPERPAGPTRLLELRQARVITAERPDDSRDFAPAILDAAGQSRDLREIRFRSFHAQGVRQKPELVLDRAVWVAERVFDNYSHWFSAHLPKLALLRDMGEIDDLVLPVPRPAWIDESLERIGIDPRRITGLPRNSSLVAERLIVPETDRFRPELLQAGRDAIGEVPADPPCGRVFISRRSARGRRLVDEDRLLSLLKRHGFEIVEMERLDLGAQIALMTRAKVVLAPHGAGLTNMLFCQPGTRIIEIADPAYPNPNFYAMAAALDHDYVWLAGRGIGEGHPLDRDLAIDEDSVRDALEAIS